VPEFLQPLAGWLSGLSPEQLYGFVFAVAFTEGVLPFVPGDGVVAFLGFLSARGGGLWIPTTIFVVVGNIIGNLVPWYIGRRYGADWLTNQLGQMGMKKTEALAERREHWIEQAYREYGWIALFLSRFIPGVRAMAPAAAGAMRVPLWEFSLILLVACSLWYGAITWIAFKLGNDWDVVKAALTQFAQGAGIGALALAAILGVGGWLLWRRRKARAAD
jgi:membrane protein DedA with SNARE-associated domain